MAAPKVEEGARRQATAGEPTRKRICSRRMSADDPKPLWQRQLWRRSAGRKVGKGDETLEGNEDNEVEDQEAPDEPADDDLGRAIADARRECETEKERLAFDKMIEDHNKLLYPTCEDGHKKLGSTLELLQWKAENGVTDSGFGKLLTIIKRKLPRVLIQGPKQPGNDIDVYLKPLVEELLQLWSIAGVPVWDEHKQEEFDLRALLFVTINDWPALGNISGQSNKGYNACTHCLHELEGDYLDVYWGIVDFLGIPIP
ncbi:hypothetical protein QYE76_024882 [Lolium multiflorum]|uniref:Uncharacterized protein n=1 Tax=Lolium multiflorum TaxID=4521 RepID=A0AAD8RD93_LOLMU|nr:hypothetical protein QYE76_024882 [Lolium multiflorum]